MKGDEKSETTSDYGTYISDTEAEASSKVAAISVADSNLGNRPNSKYGRKSNINNSYEMPSTLLSFSVVSER